MVQIVNLIHILPKMQKVFFNYSEKIFRTYHLIYYLICLIYCIYKEVKRGTEYFCFSNTDDFPWPSLFFRSGLFYSKKTPADPWHLIPGAEGENNKYLQNQSPKPYCRSESTGCGIKGCDSE